ncbi:MAG: ATP-binding protein [Planktothrix sp. GU0601_MAG3]|nr:MAG: ATP-binding protein [Planktothrix sp. GU0601_MAG3]
MENLTVFANLDALKPLADYVIQASGIAGLDKKQTYKLRLAVDEIATNIITYGYEQAGKTGDIIIAADIDEKMLKITLQDTAIFFDPTEKLSSEEQTLNQPLDDRKIGGLGIYLTISGVDEFQYKRMGDRNFNIFIMYR